MKGAGMLVVSLREFQIWSRLEYSGLRVGCTRRNIKNYIFSICCMAFINSIHVIKV